MHHVLKHVAHGGICLAATAFAYVPARAAYESTYWHMRACASYAADVAYAACSDICLQTGYANLCCICCICCICYVFCISFICWRISASPSMQAVGRSQDPFCRPPDRGETPPRLVDTKPRFSVHWTGGRLPPVWWTAALIANSL